MCAKNVQNTRGVNSVKMNVPRIILQTPINFVYRASASAEDVLDRALINVINVGIIRSILYVYIHFLNISKFANLIFFFFLILINGSNILHS